MKITLARHHGMCFGVRDALRATHRQADQVAPGQTVTVLGQLIHNPVAHRHLEAAGVRQADRHQPLDELPPGPLVITAHGVADRDRARWRASGREVVDTTCPLVHKAHHALAKLVAEGRHPVIIGKADHVEVRGLHGDFPHADIVLSTEQIDALPDHERIGVVSQTTQPADRVAQLVAHLRQVQPQADVKFTDTVCQPTKDRQRALLELCRDSEMVIAIGGRHSNNTRQLVLTAEAHGCRAHQVECADDLRREWLRGVERVGVTAGTSTLDETVAEVMAVLQAWAANPEPAAGARAWQKLRKATGIGG